MAEAPPEPRAAPEFQPSRPPAPRARHIGYLLGSAVWVLALVVLALVLHQTDAVAVALAIVAFSILLGAAMSTLMRRGRLRDERRL